MPQKILETLDLRINENGQVLLVIDNLIYDLNEKPVFRLSGSRLKSIGRYGTISINLENPRSIAALQSKNKISLAQLNEFGFFHVFDNVTIKCKEGLRDG